jgi:hypothetical protein
MLFPLNEKENGVFSVPTDLVDIHLNKIRSLAELKVTLFIIKHTSGDINKFKRISINDFINGICDDEGNLIGKGVGLARQHIIKAIKMAEQRGTILVHKERPKEKWYCINTPENRKMIRALKNKEISLNELIESQKGISNIFNNK